MSRKRTLYEVLMLHPSADIGIITSVYRQLAKRHHPDRDPDPGAAARMAELNEAYATLSDPWKRARYDRSLNPTIDPASRPASGSMGKGSSDGVWAVAVPVHDTSAQTAQHGEAGPPPCYPPPSGSVFSYGRYRGWSVSQVAYHNRDYLEWLHRSPSGRAYRDELSAVLSRRD